MKKIFIYIYKKREVILISTICVIIGLFLISFLGAYGLMGALFLIMCALFYFYTKEVFIVLGVMIVLLLIVFGFMELKEIIYRWRNKKISDDITSSESN